MAGCWDSCSPCSCVVVGVTGAAIITVGGATAGLIASLDRDLPDVKQFENLTFPQPTKVYDRRGSGYWPRSERTARRPYEDFPEPGARCDDGGGGPDLLGESGLRPPVHRVRDHRRPDQCGGRGGASSITQIACGRASCLGSLFEPGAGYLYPQGQGDHPGHQAHPGVPARRASSASSPRTSTDPYGHNAYGFAAAARVYLEAHEGADTQPGRAAGGPPAVTIGARPVPLPPEARDTQGQALPPGPHLQVHARRRRTRPAHQERLHREGPGGPAQLHPEGILDGHTRWTRITPEQYLRRSSSPSCWSATREFKYKAPHFVWAMKTRLDQMLSDRDPADIGGYKVRRPSTGERSGWVRSR